MCRVEMLDGHMHYDSCLNGIKVMLLSFSSCKGDIFSKQGPYVGYNMGDIRNEYAQLVHQS